MKFNEGERVFVKNSQGLELRGTVINHNPFREPGMEYAVNLDLSDPTDFIFVGESQIKQVKKVREKITKRTLDEVKEDLQNISKELAELSEPGQQEFVAYITFAEMSEIGKTNNAIGIGFSGLFGNQNFLAQHLMQDDDFKKLQTEMAKIAMNKIFKEMDK